jgi:hypothetical protein
LSEYIFAYLMKMESITCGGQRVQAKRVCGRTPSHVICQQVGHRADTSGRTIRVNYSIMADAGPRSRKGTRPAPGAESSPAPEAASPRKPRFPTAGKPRSHPAAERLGATTGPGTPPLPSSPPPAPKSYCVTLLLWCMGGTFGLHHWYLHRDNHFIFGARPRGAGVRSVTHGSPRRSAPHAQRRWPRGPLRPLPPPVVCARSVLD